MDWCLSGTKPLAKPVLIHCQLQINEHTLKKFHWKFKSFFIQENAFESVITWRRHQMEIFSTLLAICAGNSPVPSEFPTQRPVTRSFDVYFDMRPDKRLSKQSWGWWFETLSHSLWRHRNGQAVILIRPQHVNGLNKLKKTDNISIFFFVWGHLASCFCDAYLGSCGMPAHGHMTATGLTLNLTLDTIVLWS